MRYRPVDANGDMLPIYSRPETWQKKSTLMAVDHGGEMMPRAESMLWEGKAAVLAAVHSRLQLLLGEWWEDETLGFAIPQFMFDGTRIPAGTQMLANYIASYIAQTEGVNAVTNVSAELVGRRLIFSCTVVTPYGEAAGEVRENVLLRAVYR